ncbi:hypothetical protein CBE89_09565 [Corynebacterium striatum]|uniref:Uncharacterized protein n=1 Tax=Corynebacterium striatum TaxID=43770 RepID=A0A2Z2J5C5_CORST|nr:hypothetical protein CBE89_09565 [Corynebacterium striatum]
MRLWVVSLAVMQFCQAVVRGASLRESAAYTSADEKTYYNQKDNEINNREGKRKAKSLETP